MNPPRDILVLLVEDDPADLQALKEAFPDQPGFHFEIIHAPTLAQARSAVASRPFDVALLDLELPDSSGVDTFLQLHESAPAIPVLVLADPDKVPLATHALERGAQDYLVKQEVQAPLLIRAIRYAIDRAALQRALVEACHREHEEREFRKMDFLSQPPGTAIAAEFYSAGPLSLQAPDQFDDCVLAYDSILDLALEQRVFRTEDRCSLALHRLSDQLGYLRASPRDVVDIHSQCLKRKLNNLPVPRAQAYIEEGRFALLELMGYLASYYRNFHPGHLRAGLPS